MSGCASLASSWPAFAGAGFGAGASRASASGEKFNRFSAAAMDDARTDLSHLPLDERCDNWGDWVRSGAETTQSRSIEGDYRSPQRGQWSRSVTASPTIVNALDAQAIEHAVCVLPMFHHALLRGWHVSRSRPGGYRLEPSLILRVSAKVAGEYRGSVKGFEQAREMAYALLRDALALPAVVRRVRAREIVLEALEAVSGGRR